MADQTTVSVEEQRQVAISVLCSTPSERSLAVAVAAGGSASTPRSNTSKQLVPLDSLQKLMLKSPPQADVVEDDEQTQLVPLAKKVAAEFIGTFILMFAVVSTIVADAQHGGGAEGLVGVAASAGLAVVAVVLAVVHVSGSHLNPAVSLAMAVFGHLPRAHVLPYAAAQTMGSLAATFLAKAMYRPADPAVMATVPRAGVGAAQAFFLELVLTFVLVFVITAVATDPTSSKELVAIAIAAAIMMNALIGGPSTGPSMNPARTIAAALATGKYKDIWVYLLAPPLGAIAGAATYTLIKP
ncbi:hypothetical protein BDA96_07G040600 [Sorghum bicolor]|uniref:Uncharacterized protein n=1 Tax=Sorghum bicolor TaxID=4558 RepID=A0A921U9D8_SORBI|nr:aquaporin NIP3-3 [Sorghum bicolor]KAG0522475.1 hypothetical protein BDA96_07G040600 [Sorghum bicolor]|eukprot:XP_002445042.1 aquaporin NIP3-3 [Sorghum bicolor]